MTIFSNFVPSVSDDYLQKIHEKKLGGGVLQKKEGYRPLHEVYNYSTLSSQNYGSKNLTKVELPVKSRLNPS